MQTVSQLYTSIISGAYEVEYRFIISGTTYYQSNIPEVPSISAPLFEKFSIGNCCSKSLTLSLVNAGTIPRMAQIQVECRVKNATQNSEWIKKGTFFIDTRETDENGILHLTAYDAMLKAEYVFLESGTWVSTTAEAVINEIATAMGISVDSATTTLVHGNPFTVSHIPAIGTDGTTARELLGYIAAIYGGNFIVDDTNKLKLVTL